MGTGPGRGFSLLGLGLSAAQRRLLARFGRNGGRSQGGVYMTFRGGEFSTGVDTELEKVSPIRTCGES
jgi:hypothetical protein